MFFRYKCSLQKTNKRSSELTIFLRTVLGECLDTSARSILRRVGGVVLCRKTLSGRVDKSVSLHQGAESIRNTLHRDRHSVLRDRSHTESVYRIRTRVSRSTLWNWAAPVASEMLSLRETKQVVERTMQVRVAARLLHAPRIARYVQLISTSRRFPVIRRIIVESKQHACKITLPLPPQDSCNLSHYNLEKEARECKITRTLSDEKWIIVLSQLNILLGTQRIIFSIILAEEYCRAETIPFSF